MPDTIKHSIKINLSADTLHKYTFTYSKRKDGVLLLSGTWKNDSLKMKLKLVDTKKFLLIKRGFHWVNEHPLNK
jgi:hypothetical protein